MNSIETTFKDWLTGKSLQSKSYRNPYSISQILARYLKQFWFMILINHSLITLKLLILGSREDTCRLNEQFSPLQGLKYRKSTIIMISVRLSGCSYGGELTRFCGLAHPGKILPSWRNSYKNIMCLYEKWASPPRWNLTWFFWDLTLARWTFSIWTRSGGPAQQGGMEFSLISFVLLFRC